MLFGGTESRVMICLLAVGASVLDKTDSSRMEQETSVAEVVSAKAVDPIIQRFENSEIVVFKRRRGKRFTRNHQRNGRSSSRNSNDFLGSDLPR